MFLFSVRQLIHYFISKIFNSEYFLKGFYSLKILFITFPGFFFFYIYYGHQNSKKLFKTNCVGMNLDLIKIMIKPIVLNQ